MKGIWIWMKADGKIEYIIPKLKVAGSNPVSRSNKNKGLGDFASPFFYFRIDLRPNLRPKCKGSDPLFFFRNPPRKPPHTKKQHAPVARNRESQPCYNPAMFSSRKTLPRSCRCAPPLTVLSPRRWSGGTRWRDARLWGFCQFGQ